MKTFALSKLNYVASLIVVPQWVFLEVEQKKNTFELLWSGKDRILKRNIMYQLDYGFGCLKITHFLIFVETQRMWVKQLFIWRKLCWVENSFLIYLLRHTGHHHFTWTL